MNLNIDVHLNMERGMYERLVERAQELGLPLSAVVRDAVLTLDAATLRQVREELAWIW